MQQTPQQNIENRNRYLAMLSHDLRSAISSVIGALDQIDGEALDPEMANHRDSAVAAAREASHLLDGILDLEAIDKNEFELDITETHLGELLSDLGRRWQSRATAYDVTLEILQNPDLPVFLMIDRGRFMRVIGNLIENAIKYSAGGRVTVGALSEKNGDLIIRVSDTGPGFSPEAMEKLFQFHGRPANSRQPGSGLGLYTARSLLEQMGGDITARNEVGAVVEVRLPVTVRSSAGEIAEIAVLPNSNAPDLTGIHILLAEDNMTNQLVVTQMLSVMGATFEVACDGIEAMDMFEAGKFDLLLLDIEMPRMSGLDVMRKVRSRPGQERDVAIIALTAYAMREHRQRIAEAGADAMIAKPILGIDEFGNSILRHVKPKSETDIAAEHGASASIVDTDTFNALANSIGQEMMDELMSKVVIDLKNVRDTIEKGREQNDPEQIQSASHVLISVAGAIGATGTQRAAERLNRAAHQGDQAKIQASTATCLTGIAEILKLVEHREQL